jgi:hypothetical protein
MAWVVCGAAILVCFWASKESRQQSKLVEDPSSLRMIYLTPKGLLSTRVWWVSAGVFIISLIASAFGII